MQALPNDDGTFDPVVVDGWADEDIYVVIHADVCTYDMDGDDVPSGQDACEDGDDSIDTDGDGIPDDCDACEGYDDLEDVDMDGIPDECDDEIGECETAFAFGDAELDDIDGINRWGWSNGPIAAPAAGDVVEIEQPIYAAAGQNDVSKGFHVGDATIWYDGSEVEISIDLFEDWTATTVHVDVDSVETDTGAPGQFTVTQDVEDGVIENVVVDGWSDEDMYVVIHADVCTVEEDSMRRVVTKKRRIKKRIRSTTLP